MNSYNSADYNCGHTGRHIPMVPMDSQRLGFALLAAIVLVFTVTSATVAANPTTMTQPRSIVVLGDSISASYRIQSELGWVNLLNQTLQQRELPWQVINASISGETTGGALARLPGLLAETEPDIVIIELGGNDGLRGYPINKIRQNLERIVDAVVSSGATPLVVAMRIPPNYGDRYANAFDNVFQAVAEDKQSPFVPFLLEEVALSKELMQDDGIHPTAEAQPLLLKAIWPTLEPLL